MESIILKLLSLRKGASICPSEAARLAFEEDWSDQMPAIRKVASKMAKQNQIEICQKGIVVDPDTVKGPIRLRIPQNSNR